MPSKKIHIAFGAVTAVTLALTSVMTASAHEHRMIGAGKYMVLVGWKDEPTFTGVRNAVQFFLNDAAGKPINDLGDTLKLSVVYKDEKSGPISLMPGFDPDSGEGTPGEYDAAIIPSKARMPRMATNPSGFWKMRSAATTPMTPIGTTLRTRNRRLKL